MKTSAAQSQRNVRPHPDPLPLAALSRRRSGQEREQPLRVSNFANDGSANPVADILVRRQTFLPLLWERAGVRWKEANSNPRRTTIPGTVKLRESPAEPGCSQSDCESA